MVEIYGNTLQIFYTSRDFPAGTVHNQGYLRTDWDEILRAALTVEDPTGLRFSSRQFIVLRGAIQAFARSHGPQAASVPQARCSAPRLQVAGSDREGRCQLLSRHGLVQAVREQSPGHLLASPSGRISPRAEPVCARR